MNAYVTYLWSPDTSTTATTFTSTTTTITTMTNKTKKSETVPREYYQLYFTNSLTEKGESGTYRERDRESSEGF